MEKEKRHLLVFGYGLSLIIPFLIGVHSLHLEPGLGSFLKVVLGFIILMVIIEKISTLPSKINLWILGVQAFLFFYKIKYGGSIISLIFLAIASAVLVISVCRVELLKPLYNKWMTVAHFIGSIITGLILSVMFYGVFGLVGIVLRLLKKDLLNQSLDENADSYWVKREEVSFDKNDYEKQY